MKRHVTNDINGGEGGGYNQHLLVHKHHILFFEKQTPHCIRNLAVLRSLNV